MRRFLRFGLRVLGAAAFVAALGFAVQRRGTLIRVARGEPAQQTVRDVVKKHSEFIQYPIQLQVTKEQEEEVKEDKEDVWIFFSSVLPPLLP